MRRVPDAGRYTVNLPFYVPGETKTHSWADREAFHVAHSTVPVHSITVKLRHKPIVVTIDRTHTWNAFLLLIFVLESNPACTGSKREESRGKISQSHCQCTMWSLKSPRKVIIYIFIHHGTPEPKQIRSLHLISASYRLIKIVIDGQNRLLRHALQHNVSLTNSDTNTSASTTRKSKTL